MGSDNFKFYIKKSAPLIAQSRQTVKNIQKIGIGNVEIGKQLYLLCGRLVILGITQGLPGDRHGIKFILSGVVTQTKMAKHQLLLGHCMSR